MLMVSHYKRQAWYKQGMSIKIFFKIVYKYGIGIGTFSLDIGGVCTLPKVPV